MARVIAAMSVSLDGFVANPSDAVGPLFDWYGSGTEEFRWPGMGLTSRVSATNAAVLRRIVDETGALLCGRRLFDYTKGWGGEHPLAVPVFVVTHRAPDDWPHPDAPFTFVTEGVERAVALAKEAAGDKVVAIAGTQVAQQCLTTGLLDEIAVSLVPVLLGRGIRWFEEFDRDRVMLDDPEVVVADRVTHLRYRVRR